VRLIVLRRRPEDAGVGGEIALRQVVMTQRSQGLVTLRRTESPIIDFTA
jgi:hypothetical protein